MTDIIQELQGIGRDGIWKDRQNNPHPIAVRAASEIERLRALLDRLEAAESGMKLMREGIRRANDRVGGIETDRMNRDNLSIILCSYFEDAEGEQDENGWTLAATEGCDEVLAAIRDHYTAAIQEVKP